MRMTTRTVFCIVQYVWIEFLRQNKSGVTDRTGDRTGSKRQATQTGVKGQDRRVGTERRG